MLSSFKKDNYHSKIAIVFNFISEEDFHLIPICLEHMYISSWFFFFLLKSFQYDVYSSSVVNRAVSFFVHSQY